MAQKKSASLVRQEKKKDFEDKTLQRSLTALKKIDAFAVENYLTINAHQTPLELKMKLKTERVSSLERALILVIIRAAENGFLEDTNFILDRLVGKPKAFLGVVQTNDPLKDLSLNELMALKERLEDEHKKTLEMTEKTFLQYKLNNLNEQHERQNPAIDTTAKRIDKGSGRDK